MVDDGSTPMKKLQFIYVSVIVVKQNTNNPHQQHIIYITRDCLQSCMYYTWMMHVSVLNVYAQPSSWSRRRHAECFQQSLKELKRVFMIDISVTPCWKHFVWIMLKREIPRSQQHLLWKFEKIGEFSRHPVTVWHDRRLLKLSRRGGTFKPVPIGPRI